YEDVGSGAQALVLIHCWTCNNTFFEAQVEHFASKYRVIAVDLRGHGESDKPQQDYTMPGFASDVAWLCDQLGVRKPVLIGHSMGGNISLEIARLYPDLPAAVVMLDSVIIPPPALAAAFAGVSKALRGPDFPAASRELMGSVCIPADDPVRMERLKAIM